MSVTYNAERLRGPCYWTSVRMLLRYHRQRLGLTGYDEYEDVVRVLPYMAKLGDVQASLDRLGLTWAYMPLQPAALQRLLDQYGPAVYLAKLHPGSTHEHTVLITGLEDTPRGPVVRFNDPGSGQVGRQRFADLFHLHPPLFAGTTAAGAPTGMLAFYAREPSGVLGSSPSSALRAATGSLLQTGRPRLGERSGGAGRSTCPAVTRAGRLIGAGLGARAATATPGTTAVTAAASAGAASALGEWWRRRTAAAAGHSSVSTAGVRRGPAAGASSSDLATRQSYRVDRFGLSVPTGRIGAAGQPASGAYTRAGACYGNPVTDAAASLRERPAAAPILPGATYSDLATHRSYRVDRFGFSVPTQAPAGSSAGGVLARDDPLRAAAAALR